ncbi:hypothetical protein JCM19992_28370 [Thermostilla marina]
MAKKSAAKESLGRGRKLCRHCGEIVAARAVVCPHCNKVTAKTISKGSRSHRSVSAAKVTAELSEVAEFVKAHGGFEQATKILEDVHKLTAKVGSINDVKTIVSEVKDVVEAFK